jgi:hypothetical protein
VDAFKFCVTWQSDAARLTVPVVGPSAVPEAPEQAEWAEATFGSLRGVERVWHGEWTMTTDVAATVESAIAAASRIILRMVDGGARDRGSEVIAARGAGAAEEILQYNVRDEKTGALAAFAYLRSVGLARTYAAHFTRFGDCEPASSGPGLFASLFASGRQSAPGLDIGPCEPVPGVVMSEFEYESAIAESVRSAWELQYTKWVWDDP